jgi:DNA-binding NarL/FixJ family response regulator
MSGERYLIVDDNTLLRGSLARLIGLWRPGAMIEQAGDGAEAIEKARRFRPDLILMDIRMPRCDGIEATRQIKSELPDTRIIMLTVSEADDDLFEAISSGAHGYLLKNMQPEELFAMLEGALKGEAVVAPPMAQRILQAFVAEAHRQAELGGAGPELSPREMEVLELVSEGLTNKDIAERLYISVGTVKNHIHNILEKLHLRNRTQLVVYKRMRRVGWR